MPRIVFSDKNIARGKNFEKVCNILFPKTSREKIGAILGGVPGNTIKNWEKGGSIANRALVELERRGVSLTWLLTSEGQMLTTDVAASTHVEKPKAKTKEQKPPPEPNVIIPAMRRTGELKTVTLPVAASAAALERQSGNRGLAMDDSSDYWDGVSMPDAMFMVQVSGDSMAPVLMDKQYALVGAQYMPPYTQPKSREIVIALVRYDILSPENTDEVWEGIYCKRVQDGETTWIFTSIASEGETFSIRKENCLLWPVVGTYYAGKGRIPEED